MLAIESVIIDAPMAEVYRLLTDDIEYRITDRRITELAPLRSNGQGALWRVRGFLLTSVLESVVVLRTDCDPERWIRAESEAGGISFPGRLFISHISFEWQLEKHGAGTRVVRMERYLTKDNALGRWMERKGQPWLEGFLTTAALPNLKEAAERERSDESPAT